MKRKHVVLLPVNVNAELAGVILFLKNLCGNEEAFHSRLIVLPVTKILRLELFSAHDSFRVKKDFLALILFIRGKV